ncbi:MAG TPA: hypothetical protein VGE51_00280 [Fontimonas sp.]
MNELARGDYAYWRDGQRQAISEPWTLTRTSDGIVLRGQRIVDRRVMLDVEACYRAGHCVEMALHWNRDAALTTRAAHYRLSGEALKWRLGEQDDVLQLSAGTLLFPLLRAATGPLLSLLRQSPRPVLVPCIRDPADPLFLQPLLSQRRAVEIDVESGRISHLRYYGGEYGDGGCDCWLDELGLIQRYSWNSTAGVWNIQLVDAVVAPGFRGFGG